MNREITNKALKALVLHKNLVLAGVFVFMGMLFFSGAVSLPGLEVHKAEAAPTFTLTTVDSTTSANTGQYNSIYCVTATDCKIAYKDSTNNNLMMADCDNATCSSRTITTVDSTTAKNTGENASIFCLATDDCKIAYADYTNFRIMFADCDNATCSSRTINTVYSTGSTGDHIDLYCVSSTDCKIAIGGASYILVMLDCDDSTCFTKTTTTVDGTYTGTYPSIYCVSSTDCKISYHNDSSNDLLMADCDDATCATKTLTTVDSTTSADTGAYTSIYCVSSTDCKISYLDATNANLMMADCDDATCATKTLTTVDSTTSASTGAYTSIYCVSSTDCKISYLDTDSPYTLLLADCDNSACSSRTLTTADSITGNVYYDTSIHCVSASNCKIAYTGLTAADLMMADVTFPATWTSTQTGNWNVGTTWGGACSSICVAGTDYPGSADDAIIANTHTITVNASVSTGTVTINSGGTLNLSSNTLTLSGTGTSFVATGTFTPGTGTIQYTGSTANITATTYYNLIAGGTGTYTLASGTTTVTNTATVSSSATLSLGSNTLSIRGTGTPFVATGTFTPGTGTIKYDGATANVTATTYYNLTVGSGETGTYTLATGTTTVTNNVTILSGNTLNLSSNTLTLSGTGTPLTATGTFTASTGTVNYTGATATLTPVTFYNLTIGTNTVATGGGSFTVASAGTFTINSGATYTPASAAEVITGTSASITGSGTVKVTRTAATADFATQYAFTTKTLTNLIVDYAGASQTISNLTYGGLKVSGSVTGATTATVGGALTVTGTLTPSSGTITMNNGSSISNSGTLTFQALTIASGATVTANTSYTVAGTLTVSSTGVLSPTSGTITFTGATPLANSGTFTASGSHTVLFANSWEATTATLSGSSTFYNFTSTTAGKAIRFTAGTTTTINGLLTLTGSAGNNVTLNSNTGSSSWTINHQGTENITYTTVTYGACNGASTSITMSGTGNTNGGNNGTCWAYTLYNLTSSQSGNWNVGTTWGGACASACVAGTTYPNTTEAVTIAAGHTVTLAGNQTAAGVTINSTGVLSLGTSTLTMKGNLLIASGGTVTKGTGGLLFSGGTAQTITDNNATKQDLGTVQISGGGADGTGGTITYSGGYTIHTFTTDGTFNPGTNTSVDYLVVAGGGGGGGSPLAGGGGAGGLLTSNGYAVTNQNYTVTVGAGGAGGTGQTVDPWVGVIGSPGSNSVFSSFTAVGGGGGGRYNGVAAANGGSGGGAGYAGAIGTGTTGQGNNGGTATTSPNYGAGGGGGAGAVGSNGTTTAGGAGGVGTASSISGASTYYAGGGGGSHYLDGSAGAGGNGGGGAGGLGNGVNGTANTGGGGGGAERAGTGVAGSGGSGIVIIRYLTPSSAATTLNLGSSVKMTALTIDSAQIFSANGSNTLDLTGTGTPLTATGTFTYSTGTVQYTGTTATVTATTFNNLTLGGTGTYTMPATTTTIKGNLVVTTGATVTKGAGTVVFSGASSQTITGNVINSDLGALQISSSGSGVTSNWCNISSTACNSSWLSRKKITLDNSTLSGSLTDFPVLVSLTSANIDYSKTQNSGQDIRFVDSDNTTALSYEIEKWDEAGTSLVWVKVPTVTNNATDYIYMYYNNSKVADGQAATSVWDSNFKAVYHLPNGTTLSANDSTTTPSNGTITEATASTGKIDGGVSFDGTNDKIDYGSGGKLASGTQNWTASTWINTTTSARRGILTNEDGSNNGYYFDVLANGTLRVSFQSSVGNYSYKDSSVTVNNGAWHHVSVSWNYTTKAVLIYVDGVDVSTGGAISGTVASIPASSFRQGYSVAASAYFIGSMDEIRISNFARTADWVKAEYNTSNNTMNTFGSEEFQNTWCNISSTACNSSWLARRKITLNNSTATTNLTDFPVLVSLSSSNIDYSKTQNSGQDIRFVDADGTTALSYEIEKWDEAGTSLVWVKVPQLDKTSDDYIWMYYNNASVADSQAGTSVWDTNYKGVWHLPNGTTLTANDSTSNANNGSITGTSATTGKIGGAANFGATGNVNTHTSVALSGISYTISTWFNWPLPTTGSWNTLARGADTSGTGDHQIIINETGWLLGIYNNQTAGGFRSSGFVMTTLANGWHHLTAVGSGTTTVFYIDGVSVGTSDYKSTSVLTYWGNYQGGGQNWGIADEIRLSTGIARSADWIKAEYNTANNTMNSFGSEEVPVVEVLMGSSIKATSLTIDASKTFNVNGSNTLTLTGNGASVLANSGTFTVSTGTVDFSSSATTGTTVPAMTYYNLTMNSAGNAFTPAGDITANNLTITAGTFTAPVTLTVNGDFSNSGTFTHNSGTVVIAPTATTKITQVLGTSGTTFYNLTNTTPDSTIKFKNGNTYVFANTLTATGTDGHPIWLRSYSDDLQWTVTFTGTPSLNYINVRDGACSGGITLSGNSLLLNQGNNGSCWGFIVYGGGGGSSDGTAGSSGSSAGGGGAGSGMVQATATANLTTGAVTSVTVTNGGSGYTTAPSVCFQDTVGSGAVATSALSGSTVISITVSSGGGASYTGSVTVGIAPPPGDGSSGCSSAGGGGAGGGGGAAP